MKKVLFIVLPLAIFFRIAYPGDTLPAASPSPQIEPLPSLPPAKILAGDYQVFQTFNNCGPASLSMLFSYYGISISQEELGRALRPYQNDQGDNDDKSVTLEEMAAKAGQYGLIAVHRPSGSIQLIKEFINTGIPVITETLLDKNSDIGHYRVVKGYDDFNQEIIQDDSYQGKNIRFSYPNFEYMWQAYNYKFLVLVPFDKQTVAKQILGDLNDQKSAWQKAADSATGLNRSVALYHIGDYRGSVIEFEKVQPGIPHRTLWYTLEPILAYYELGEYGKVFTLTEEILNNGNQAFSQLYLIRGNIYRKEGKLEDAKSEYKKAAYYNTNLESAKTALNQIN